MKDMSAVVHKMYNGTIKSNATDANGDAKHKAYRFVSFYMSKKLAYNDELEK
jgi:hypothetical protein